MPDLIRRPKHPYAVPRKSKVGRPTVHQCIHRIAYTETVRGYRDEIPTLLFLGAPWFLLQDVCEAVCRMMDGKVKDITLQWEHSCRRKNGKHYWRIAVGIIGLDEAFISMKEFVGLIVSKMTRTAACVVKRFNIEPFLNL